MTRQASADNGLKVFVPPRDVVEPAFADNNIPVFFGCDDAFLPHAVTAAASMLEHASPENNYDIFIVQWGASREKMARAAEWIRRYPNASLRFIDIAGAVDLVGREDFQVTRAYGLAIYFRFFAPSLFPRYDRIVYLDSDMVLFGDVAELYHCDLGPNLLAACHDCVMEEQSLRNPSLGAYWREQLGKEPGEGYFNSGCLVMDLAGLRREDVEAGLFEKMRRIRGTQLPDQDVLNAVLNGKVRYVGGEWNYPDWMADPVEEGSGFGLVSAEMREAIRRNREKVKILHYCEKKPWTADYTGKNDAYYWLFAALTPFYGETVARLNAGCARNRLAGRYLLLTLQEGNFLLRSLFASAEEKGKYASRRRNVAQRRRALVGQMRRMGHFGLGAGTGERLHPKGRMAVVIRGEEHGK